MKNALTTLLITIAVTISISAQSDVYLDIYTDLLHKRQSLHNESSKTDQLPSEYIEINATANQTTIKLIAKCDSVYRKVYIGTQTSAIDGIDQCISTTIKTQRDDYGENPLEKIWDAYLNYKALNNTVNDQMMNLQEWFEFEDQINAFLCSWDQYEVVSQQELFDYSPIFDKKKKEDLNVEMRQCIEEFLHSTESGFRLDFIMPCDRIGNVIEENLLLFASKRRSNS